MASKRQGGLMGISGEDLLGRISELPGAKSLLDGVTTLRERVDELQKRMRGLDELTRRVDALERRVDQLSGGKGSTRRGRARKPASSRSAASKPKPSTEVTPESGDQGGSGDSIPPSM
jgi:hypothetical protein